MRRPAFATGAILTLALASWPLASQAPRCAKRLDACIVEKRQAFANRGVIGCLWAPVAADEQVPHLNRLEYLVRAVPPGYPAQEAGLKEGDLLLEMNGKSLLGLPAAAVRQMHESIQVGQVVSYKVLRGNQRLEIRIRAGKPDPRSIEVWIGQHIQDQHSPEEYRHYLQTLRAAPAGRAPAAHP